MHDAEYSYMSMGLRKVASHCRARRRRSSDDGRDLAWVREEARVVILTSVRSLFSVDSSC